MSLSERIDELLAGGEADPHVITDKLLPSLTEDEREMYLRRGVHYEVRAAVRNQRHGGPVADAPDGGKPRSDKWEGVSRATKNPMTWPVSVTGRNDGWKPLADCTVEEVRRVGELYMARARANKAYADRYRVLADEMTRAKVDLVRDLGEAIVRRVMAS